MTTSDLRTHPVVRFCGHQPTCPTAAAADAEAARVIVSFPEQGWSLLCNGVIVFDDTGLLLPDGSEVAPHRGPAPHGRTRLGGARQTPQHPCPHPGHPTRQRPPPPGAGRPGG